MGTSYYNYKKTSLENIKISGWLKKQLELQAKGLSGRVGKVFEDLSDNSAWLGGSGEAWERGPYYLDGLIPLAYITGDKILKERANRWIQAIFNSVREDGNFGPTRTDDWWPRAVALKALINYYDITQDKRVISLMKSFFDYMAKEIDNFPPKYWASARLFEFLIPINFLYEKTKSKNLLELVDVLKKYSYDWINCFFEFPYKKTAQNYLNKFLINAGRKIASPFDAKLKVGVKPLKKATAKNILKFNNRKIVRNIMLTHGVNNAMALKYPILLATSLNKSKDDIENYNNFTKESYAKIMKYHGNATGLFSGDEHLNGNSATKGIELCLVVESMYSFEILLEKTGDAFWADLLELASFNALPATFTPDMCAHQYVQQVNQISCTEAKRDFFDVDKDASIYGLKPNFACCLANMHQGFPKLVQSLCLLSDEEIAFFVFSQAEMTIEWKGVKVVIDEITNYPFEDNIKFVIKEISKKCELPLAIRVPKYSTANLYINGKIYKQKQEGVIRFKEVFKKGDIIEIKLDTPIKVVENPDKSISLRKGSLLLSLGLSGDLEPIRGYGIAGKKTIKKKSDKLDCIFFDYIVKSKDKWNIAPALFDNKVELIKETYGEIAAHPFDPEYPPLKITTKAVVVENWFEENNSAGEPPEKPLFKIGEGESIVMELVPYGCTNLRIAHFPKVEITKN